MTQKNKFNPRTFVIKTRIRDLIKYDFNFLKLPLSFLLLCLFYIKHFRGQHLAAIELLSNLFRTGWLGSKNIPTKIIKNLFSSKNNNPDFTQDFYNSLLNSIIPLPQTEKFFSSPEELFEGVVIVLKSRTDKEKGVILIKYSYYFPLFFKLFDVKEISKKYYFVLEPSWAGLCDPGILIYTTLQTPVFVMTYEKRDKEFIEKINTNLIPVDIGPNWWVNYKMFIDNKVQRDIDIIIIAGWSEFKRHWAIFKMLKELKQHPKKEGNYSVALAGYHGDMTLQQIKDMAKFYEVDDLLQIHEWISPNEVSQLLQRSKVNILWSRFEGNNRAIIEGMFCNTPCIIREGHNYGEHYDYINKKTGEWSNESNFMETIKSMLDTWEQYSPREYVLDKHNCTLATKILSERIKLEAIKESGNWTSTLSVKVNELHGMKYFTSSEDDNYKEDYTFIKKQIK